MTASISISGISIHQDSEGRYSVNDLHKASGSEQRHRPKYWLEALQTKELITEITKGGNPPFSKNSGISLFSPIETKRGCKGGTYVCKELVYSYAMWISAAFSLKVIRAYDALVNVVKAQESKPQTTTNDRTPLRDAINMLVGKKGLMYPEAYTLIHQRFDVGHIDELTPHQIPLAIEYVHKLALEGELLERDRIQTQPQSIFNLSAIDQDGEWRLSIKNGRVTSARRLDDGEYIISVASFGELMERAGNIIIHYTELQRMNPSELVGLVDKMRKHHHHWQLIMNQKNKIA
ncbi:KilA-N domain-containing protein [Hafnia alvei]|uniref:KilA-N domain-containing protein n=1 Tax=Hafnia alvei TaxID=569 RepID=UPI00345D49DC